MEADNSDRSNSFASALGNGGTRSCSVLSASAYSGGTKSGRTERACPTLMAVGPACWTSSRSCWARCLRYFSSSRRMYLSYKTLNKNPLENRKSYCFRKGTIFQW